MNATIKACLLFCSAMVAFSWGASARAVRLWSEDDLQKASDLIVLATPIETKNLDETTTLGWDTAPTGVIFRGVDTTIKVLAVLKGNPTSDRIVLHHYRQDGALAVTNGPFIVIPSTLPNGPDFISFVLNKTNRLVLNLVKDGPNRYAPVTGQIDPARSFRPLAEADASTAGQFPTDSLARRYFDNYLHQCGTNDLRCLWFLDNNPRVGMVMTINLEQQTVYTVRDVYDWAEQAAHTRPLSDSQVLTLKQIINDLLPSAPNSDFSRSLFVSKRNGDKTEVFQYDRHHIPPAVRRIYDLGGGYLEPSLTNNASQTDDGKDLAGVLRKIPEHIPELSPTHIKNAPTLPDTVWRGDAVAEAIFVLPKHLRYMPNILHGAPRIPYPDLEVTVARYDSSSQAQEAVEMSLRLRQAAPKPKESYQGAVLYRFSSGGGVTICHSGEYVIEVDPFSEAAEPLVMKTLDVVLAELPKIAGTKETTDNQ